MVQEVAVMLDISHGSKESTNLDVLQFHKVSAQWSLQKRLLDWGKTRRRMWQYEIGDGFLMEMKASNGEGKQKMAPF